jgi:hypothetical protein
LTGATRQIIEPARVPLLARPAVFFSPNSLRRKPRIRATKSLKLNPIEKQTFTLPTARTSTERFPSAASRSSGVERHSPVILGEPGDDPLPGAITLEVLGLVLDQFKRELRLG